MKLLITFLTFVTSTVCLAQTLTCPLIEPQRPEDWPKDFLSIVVNDTTIASVDLILHAPDGNGEYQTFNDTLFSIAENRRGGFSVKACETDINTWNQSSGHTQSACEKVDEEGVEALNSELHLSTTETGNFNTTAHDMDTGNTISRRFDIEACIPAER